MPADADRNPPPEPGPAVREQQETPNVDPWQPTEPVEPVWGSHWSIESSPESSVRTALPWRPHRIHSGCRYGSDLYGDGDLEDRVR